MHLVQWSWHERNGVENDWKLSNYSICGWWMYSASPLGSLVLVWGSDRCSGPTFSIGQWESVQNQEKRFEGKDGIQGRGEVRKKKYERHKWHPKMSLYSKFHPNRTMGMCSQSMGNVWRDLRGVGGFQNQMQTSNNVKIKQWESVQN